MGGVEGAGGCSSGQVLAQSKTAAPASIGLVQKPANPPRQRVDAEQLAAASARSLSASSHPATMTCCPAAFIHRHTSFTYNLSPRFLLMLKALYFKSLLI